MGETMSIRDNKPYTPFYASGAWYYYLAREHSSASFRKLPGLQAVGPFPNEDAAREAAQTSRIRNTYGSSYEMHL